MRVIGIFYLKDLPAEVMKRSSETIKEEAFGSKPDKNVSERLKCSECEFTTKYVHSLNRHRRMSHMGQELKCSVCDASIKGEFRLFCHKYLIHDDIENVSKWLLKCSLCPHKGYARQSYEHGKEHNTEKVSFKTSFKGAQREMAIFRYSSNTENMKDSILEDEEFTSTIEEHEDDKPNLEKGAIGRRKKKLVQYQCPIKYCLFDTNNVNDMREHLIKLHNVVRKAALKAKIKNAEQAVFTNFSKGDSKSSLETQCLICQVCYFETAGLREAYIHGWKHRKSNIIFHKYEDSHLVGSVKCTYQNTLKCRICEYKGRSTKQISIHSSQVHLTEFSNEIDTANGDPADKEHDPLETQDVNEEMLFCYECGHTSSTSFQMDVHQALFHCDDKKRIFCPSEYCCYEVDNSSALRSHLLKVHELTESDLESNSAENTKDEYKPSPKPRFGRKDASDISSLTIQKTQKTRSKDHFDSDWVEALEGDILQEEDLELDKSNYKTGITIKIANNKKIEPTSPEKTKKSELRIKCQNIGCSYYCSFRDMERMLDHSAICSKKSADETAKKPDAKKIKTEPSDKVSFKCWMCGMFLMCKSSLNSHTYIHAREDNNFNLKVRYSVHKMGIKLDTLVIAADSKFVPRASSNVPLYGKIKPRLRTSLEYDPNLPVLSCDQCNFKTNLEESLNKHTKLHWNAEKEAAFKSGNWFTCGVCYYHCFDPVTFTEHGNTHKNRPVSDIRKTAKDSWNF